MQAQRKTIQNNTNNFFISINYKNRFCLHQIGKLRFTKFFLPPFLLFSIQTFRFSHLSGTLSGIEHVATVLGFVCRERFELPTSLKWSIKYSSSKALYHWVTCTWKSFWPFQATEWLFGPLWVRVPHIMRITIVRGVWNYCHPFTNNALLEGL